MDQKLPDFREEFYKDYVDFKDWNEESDINPSEMFEIEFERLALPGKLKILEVGFGKGELLDWSKQKGHDITGIEIIPELVSQSKSRGHNVFQLAAQSLEKGPFSAQNFDLIVIFDVLEHLYITEIVELLKKCGKLLKSNGKILLRFPNGLSPIGIVQHMKDITHVTILSPERMVQLGRITGFKVIFSGNTARPLNQGKRPRWMRVLLYKLRNILEKKQY